MKDILLGWVKLGLMNLGYEPTPEELKLAEHRTAICDQCLLRRGNKCRACGCNLSAKTLLKSSACPKNKW